MSYELTHLGTLRAILLSCAVLTGCTASDGTEEQPPVQAHEGGSAHAHPPDAGVLAPLDLPAAIDAGSPLLPTACAPDTYEQIQAAIFDAPKYGCAQAFCHGDPAGHLDLRRGFSYDSLLGRAHVDGDAHADDAAHADGDAHVDESTPHTHAPGAQHLVVLHHEGEAHPEEDPSAHSHDAHVIPGNPEASVLYDRLRAKVQGTQPVMGGAPMPLGPTPISKAELKAIELWIKAGAPRTGLVSGTDALCPSASLDAGR